MSPSWVTDVPQGGSWLRPWPLFQQAPRVSVSWVYPSCRSLFKSKPSTLDASVLHKCELWSLFIARQHKISIFLNLTRGFLQAPALNQVWKQLKLNLCDQRLMFAVSIKAERRPRSGIYSPHIKITYFVKNNRLIQIWSVWANNKRNPDPVRLLAAEDDDGSTIRSSIMD